MKRKKRNKQEIKPVHFAIVALAAAVIWILGSYLGIY
jgi:hypothetical protein